MELGLISFADATLDPTTGRTIGHEQRLRDLVQEIELADQVGLDVYGIGEHHRPDYAASTPATILAYAAARTERIRLSSAVTVLSSEEPVRVFQQFSTLDLLSGGRAEIMVGRGSFVESFPLFGYDLNDYNELFSEKLDLLLRIRDNDRVTWSGRLRPPLDDQAVYPRPKQEPLPIWIAVGGTPASAVRAGMLGLPMTLAIIGGEPARFVTFAQLYRESARRAGYDPATLPLAVNFHGYVAESRERAIEESYPAYKVIMDRIGRERGWPPHTRQQFEAGTTPRGHLFIGSPEEVATKILTIHKLFGNARFMLQMVGSMPHAQAMRSIELFGTKVAPIVREEVARRQHAARAGVSA